jgi:hypothetical protein
MKMEEKLAGWKKGPTKTAGPSEKKAKMASDRGHRGGALGTYS